jgi:glyoxylase-like metal-dependent hydrolase (beta-lactamase superfamily II)
MPTLITWAEPQFSRHPPGHRCTRQKQTLQLFEAKKRSRLHRCWIRFSFIIPLYRLLPDAEGVDVDHVVGEANVLSGDLTVIASPGHTQGNVSDLLEREGGVLFVGDAAVASRAGQVKRGG